MPKTRERPDLPSLPRPFPVRASLSGGNGSVEPDTDAQRLTRLEATLEQIQRTLDVQLQRISDMQVLIDRLTAERR